MAGYGKRLRLRLFLEGVEVPVISAQVTGLPNAPLLAAIQIPPLAEGTRFLPRTKVDLFFLDFYLGESPFVSNQLPSATTKNSHDPSAYEQSLQRRLSHVSEEERPTGQMEKDYATDFANEQYKVLFTGEILGFEWTKNQANRSLVLQCADPSNYWDYAYQWNNTDLFGPGIKAMFSGGSTNLFTDFLSSPGEVITNILRTPCVTYPNLKGLAGGIIHLLESIGGSYYHDNKISGQNIFFSIAELRLHITQMVAALEHDPTASRLLAIQGYGGLLNRLLGGLGSQASIRKSINALQGIIFHETYAQPCPLYEPGTEGTVSGQVRVNVGKNPKTSFISNTATLVLFNIGGIKELLQAGTTTSTATTDKKQVGKDRKTIVIRLQQIRGLLQSTVMRLRGVKVPAAAPLFSTASQSIAKAISLTQAKWHPGAVAVTAQIEKELDAAAEKLKKAEKLEVGVTPKNKIRPARLNQQIFRPDVWFTAPPRCNVLFPEAYDTLQYRRQFMEEPTRLLLKTNDEFFGEDELFDRFYFAPKARTVKQDKAKLQGLLNNDLLEHELLTGILPVFEKMGELNIFAARGGVVKDKVPQVGLAQRSANFLYFKYRFAARQAQVRGKFNPYVVMGFPGVVIDKYVDVDTLKLHNELLQKVGRPTRDINKLLGTNFLGNFTQVTHTVNQQAGATELVLTYPRQPEEGVEFLGATDREEVTVSKRFETDVSRSTDVASIATPKIGSVGPNLGRIVEIEEVTDQYKGQGGSAEGALSTKPLLLFGNDRQRAPRPANQRVTLRVPVGFLVDARGLSAQARKELGIQEDSKNLLKKSEFGLGGSAIPVVINVFRITEEVPRYKQEAVDLPAEEYIRPGWYGDVWHPAKIGEAYNTFFRIGSITDPHQITDTGGAGLSATNENANQALADADGAGVGDPRADTSLVFELTQGASIEQAVAYLVATYSFIKQNGRDVEEFIRAYTWRPIASLVDMFGTSDLILSSDGSEVIQGVEGFHSRAFGDFDDLFGLVVPEIENVVGIKRGSTAATRGDTRRRKRAAIRDYLAAIALSRAILG